MSFWDQMAEVAGRHDVLRHPFYLRWADGELSTAELADYAGQYRHAVIALAASSGLASQSPDAGPDAGPLLAHAMEEITHIMLWDGFLARIRGAVDAAPTAETRDCVRAWIGPTAQPLLERLVGLYAIESAQPEVSAVEARALDKHYQFGRARYFELHRHRDLAHVAALQAQIDRRLPGADEPALLEVAVSVLRAHWRLLDGVDRRPALQLA